MLHRVSIESTRVVCSCGLRVQTNTEGEAQRLAYNHAQSNTPAVVEDHRHVKFGTYQHRWRWAKSLNILQMDEFIKRMENRTTETVVIYQDGETQTHLVSDLLEAVKYCREEYRKDQKMTNQEEV